MMLTLRIWLRHQLLPFKKKSHINNMNLNRRNFLISGLASAACLNVEAGTSVPSSTLRFCAFADIHYYPGVFPHDTRAWLERILARAEQTKCDMVIHMGDFCHTPQSCRDYADFYNDFHIKTYHTIGNHDDDGNEHERTLEAYRLTCGHYYFDRGGFRFIVTDTNNFFVEGKWSHYSKSNYYKVAKAVKKSISRVPPEQLEWLKEVIDQSPYPCIVTSHASYERAVGGSPDGVQIRQIFNAANAKNPGRVRLVINGHHHQDNVRILDNIVYFDMNSANYDWIDKVHSAYPEEYKTKWRLAHHTLMWDDPLSAVIEIGTDGTLKVDGTRSTFHLGVTPQVAGIRAYDDCGRTTSPIIQSFALKMNYC